MEAPGLAWFLAHVRAADILPESEPERPVRKEVPSLPASYSRRFGHRHQRFEDDAIQSSEERNDLLSWRRRAHEHLAETAVNDLVPDTHHSFTPLDFMARQLRDAFQEWTRD